jgi:hypothetical protein
MVRTVLLALALALALSRGVPLLGSLLNVGSGADPNGITATSDVGNHGDPNG